MAADRGIDRAAPALRASPDDGKVGALEAAVPAMGGELLRQALMGRIGLRHHEQARRVLVEAMDDARPSYPANARQALTAMGHEGVDESAGLMAGRRMDDKAGRFVDDDEGVVLIDDVECDGLGGGRGRDGRGQAHADMLTRLDLAARLQDGRPLDSDAAIGNKGLESGPARLREPALKEAVEPLARLVWRNGRFQQF